MFVPAGYTGELQPLDVGVNQDFKNHMKNSFAKWYAEEVREAMGHGNAIEDIKVDLRASLIKPLHANWVISAISVLATDTLKKPFEKIGIVEQ